MASQFPAKIDDSITIPILNDNTSLVKSSSINSLRDAVIAIESALGVSPASVYGTIKERLNAIDSSISTIIETGQAIILSGDLGGTSISQTVIGLQGNPVSNNFPSDGYVLTWDNGGNEWVPQSIFSSETEEIPSQQFTTTVDLYGTVKDVLPKNIQTTDATQTTIDSFVMPSNSTLIVSSVVSGIKSDNTLAATYFRSACFRNNGGTVTQVGTTQDGGTFEDDTVWDSTIDNSTTTIRIRVTGDASTTIRWSCISNRLEVIS